MSTTEDYLDQLLNGVLGIKPDNEQPETLDDTSNVIYDDVASDVSYSGESSVGEKEDSLSIEPIFSKTDNTDIIHEPVFLEDSENDLEDVTNMEYVEVNSNFLHDDILEAHIEEDVPSEEVSAEEPVVENVVEETTAEPVVENVVEEIIAEPVVENLVEEPISEPVVENVVEDIIAEPVVENVVEDIIAEPAVENLVEEPIAEPVVENIVEDIISEPVIENVVEETIAEPVVENVVEETIAEPTMDMSNTMIEGLDNSNETMSEADLDAMLSALEGGNEAPIEAVPNEADSSVLNEESVINQVEATVIEEPIAEPVVENLVEEPIAEPAVENLVEEPIAEPVVENIVEDIISEPVVENLVEEPIAEPVVENVVEDIIAETVVENVVEETIAEPAMDMSNTMIEGLDNSSETMSEADLDAMLSAFEGGNEAPIEAVPNEADSSVLNEESVINQVEATVIEEPISEPVVENLVEEPIAEPVVENVVEDIIAEPVVENVVEETIAEPAPEPVPEPAPAIPTPTAGGGNEKMSDEEIAALFSAAAGNEASAEPAPEPTPEPTSEPVPESTPAPAIPTPAVGGGNEKMSDEEIAALFSAAAGNEATAEPEPTEQKTDDMTEADLDALLSEYESSDKNESNDDFEQINSVDDLIKHDENSIIDKMLIGNDFDEINKTEAELDSMLDNVMSESEMDELLASFDGNDINEKDESQIEEAIKNISIEGGGLDRVPGDDEMMSENQVDDLLKSIEEMGDPTQSSVDADADLNDILAGISDDKELSEIGDILDKNDNFEAVSEDSEDDDADSVADFLNGEDSEEELSPKDKKKAEKERKRKEKEAKKLAKKNKSADGDSSEESEEKKENIFKRIFAFLMDNGDDEDEEDSGNASKATETDDVAVFAEETATDIAKAGAEDNEKILDELGETEGAEGKPSEGKSEEKTEEKSEEKEEAPKKKEKKKKEKKKKEKKKKAPKDKKPPKPKKVKQPKEKKDSDLLKMPKIPKKTAFLIFLLAASIGAGVYAIAIIVPKTNDVKKAQLAFEEGDYETTYMSLTGHDNLNEEEQELFNKNLILYKLLRKYQSYENYMDMGMEVDAMNALIQAVGDIDDNNGAAEQYGVTEQFEELALDIITTLEDVFGVSLDMAREWLSINNTKEYTRTLNEFINGDYVDGDSDDETYVETYDYEDYDPVIEGEEAEFNDYEDDYFSETLYSDEVGDGTEEESEDYSEEDAFNDSEEYEDGSEYEDESEYVDESDYEENAEDYSDEDDYYDEDVDSDMETDILDM